MKNNIQIKMQDNKYFLSTKENVDQNIFHHKFDAIYNNEVCSNYPLNRIELPVDLFRGIRKDKKYILLDTSNGMFFEVNIYESTELKNYNFACTNFIKEKLQLSQTSTCVFLEINSLSITTTLPQRIDNLKEGKIIISSLDSENKNIIIDKRYSFHSIVNLRTGGNIIMPTEKITLDNSLRAGSIKLSYYQRIILDLITPLALDNKDYVDLLNRCNTEEKIVVKKCYDEDNFELSDAISFETSQKLTKIFEEYLKNEILIYPILESFKFKNHIGLVERVTRFYVGKSIICLKCGRPYQIDENKDVIRISSANMKILGLNEMERVVLTHRNKKYSCKVLSINDNKRMLETNKKADFEYVIGVPAHIRKSLGIVELNNQIKIERDTKFLFKKNLNMQLIPILLAIFSIRIFENNFLLSLLLSMLSIPFISYLSFSEKRNNRG